MGPFFKNKLGITFDGVKTGPYADAPNIYRAMTEGEKQQVQNGVDRIYLQFRQRVAEGRRKDINYIDSIAQGRVWSGDDAIRLGLVDRVGSLQDAINSAARMAKLDVFGLREYPEVENWLDNLLGRNKNQPAAMVKDQLGDDNFRIYQQMVQIREMTRSVQARMPFEFVIK
jgi:protease-4